MTCAAAPMLGKPGPDQKIPDVLRNRPRTVTWYGILWCATFGAFRNCRLPFIQPEVGIHCWFERAGAIELTGCSSRPLTCDYAPCLKASCDNRTTWCAPKLGLQAWTDPATMGCRLSKRPRACDHSRSRCNRGAARLAGVISCNPHSLVYTDHRTHAAWHRPRSGCDGRPLLP